MPLNMETGQRETASVVLEKAIIANVIFPNSNIDPHDPLGEIRALVDTAGALIVDTLTQKRRKPDLTTFMGKGKVKELAQMVKAHDAQVIIFDNDLRPSQIGNIQEVVECKVLDRSEIILDIFASRAKTHEAKLQVELAQLQYTYPRLRAMWSHLDRLGGGGIGTRGPGEQQLETDRRIVQRKKIELEKEIADVQIRKTREVQKRNQDHYTVGIVGYTNAGKSTLFNTSTRGGAYADDKLFATLTSRTRKWDLGDADEIMLTDTVGFVRDLPHHLVASFRATLEEAIHADLLLIVLDVSHPRAAQQLQTVQQVLDDVGAADIKRLLLLNKTDLLHSNAELLTIQQQYPDAIPMSAKTGLGIDRVVKYLKDQIKGQNLSLNLQVDLTDGKTIHFLETRALVQDRRYKDHHVIMKVKLGKLLYDQLRGWGTSAKEIPDDQDEHEPA